MNLLFNLFATPLGYLMHWIYQLVPVYFLSLVLFTVLVRLVLFPLSIKNQKSQVDRARLAPRLERIQKKYGQDRQKMMQKQQQLYEKEGVKMTGGCLPMVLQMLVLFSVIAVIYKPLTYIQRVSEADIATCVNVAVESEKEEITKRVNADDKITPSNKQSEIDKQTESYKNSQFGGYYAELNLFKALESNAALREQMVERFRADALDAAMQAPLKEAVDRAVEEAKAAATEEKPIDETAVMAEAEAKFKTEFTKSFDYGPAEAHANEVVNTVVETGKEFSLFGVSLLDTPSKDGIRPNWLWLIAIASGLSAFLSGKLSMKYSKASMSAEQQQMGGCSTGTLTYMMPIMSLVFSFTVPAGVAVYWVFSNLLAMVQTVVLNRMYNPAAARAKAEQEYAERRQRKKEEKARLKEIHLAEQAAWQQEENEKRERAKGDITKKKKATTPATSAQLPENNTDGVDATAPAEEEISE